MDRLQRDLIFIGNALVETFTSYELMRKSRGLGPDADIDKKFSEARLRIEQLLDPTVTAERAALPPEQRVEIDKIRVNAFMLLLRSIGNTFSFTHDEMQTVKGFAVTFNSKDGNYRFDLVRKQ